jgi:hypothetical protein
MPPESDLRARWRARGGEEAYRRDPHAETAYQTFRAYYAYLASASGTSPEVADRDLADRAFLAATGGTFDWNGRATLLPWGRSASEVAAEIHRLWPEAQRRWSWLANNRPEDFDLQAVGQNRYQLMIGDEPQRAMNGEPIILRLRDPTDPPR